jgi:uncharacterized membrane protein YeaQ/YmgE (transglycosylase-associated protein family)
MRRNFMTPEEIASLSRIGALMFGLVVGWITYRTLRHSEKTGLSDIATVIGAVGGAAVTKLFPKDQGEFGMYCIGLTAGFFLYIVVFSLLPKDSNLRVWMGGQDGSPPNAGGGGGVGGGGIVPPM